MLSRAVISCATLTLAAACAPQNPMKTDDYHHAASACADERGAAFVKCLNFHQDAVMRSKRPMIWVQLKEVRRTLVADIESGKITESEFRELLSDTDTYMAGFIDHRMAQESE